MSPGVRWFPRYRICVPRASGDEPPSMYTLMERMRCSPRERG